MREFTRLAQAALQKAQEVKEANGDLELTSMHLAVGLMRSAFDFLEPALNDSGLSAVALAEDLETAVTKLPKLQEDSEEERVSFQGQRQKFRGLTENP